MLIIKFGVSDEIFIQILTNSESWFEFFFSFIFFIEKNSYIKKLLNFCVWFVIHGAIQIGELWPAWTMRFMHFQHNWEIWFTGFYSHAHTYFKDVTTFIKLNFLGFCFICNTRSLRFTYECKIRSIFSTLPRKLSTESFFLKRCETISLFFPKGLIFRAKTVN